MSWPHSITKQTAGVKRVSPLEILVRFEDEHDELLRLALLITGDIEAAERSVSKAHEMAVHRAGPFPFREQLTEWVKWMTIKTAIAKNLHEIAPCEPKYVNQTCDHSECLLRGNDSKLQEFHNLLFQIDPEIVIAELDPLARAVAILRTTARASILDCTLRLNLPPDTVLAANCRAKTWIAEKGDRSETGVMSA